MTVAGTSSHAESVIGFITGYLLPVSLIDGSDTSVVIVSAAAYLFLLVVAVRSHLVYFNPLLAVFGLHLFDVDVGPDASGIGARYTVLVNAPVIQNGSKLTIYGAAGSIERAKVV